MPRGSPRKPGKTIKRNNELPASQNRPPTNANAKPNEHVQPIPYDNTNATETRLTEIPSSISIHHKSSIIKPEILEFFLLNIEGINPNVPKHKLKIKSLEEEVNNSDQTIPFFALTETHLNESIFDAEIQIKNYEVIRSDRIDRRKGGVALYLHHTITVDETKKFSDKFTEAIMVHIKKCKLVIIIVYRAPNTPLNSFKNCLDSIKLFTNKFQGCDVIATGDYNFRTIDWKTEIVGKLNITVEEQEQAAMFLNFTHQQLLTQMVTENTRKDKSILDLILTTDPDMVHNICVEKTKDSDHDVVRCSFVHTNLQIQKEKTTKTFQQKHPLDMLNVGRADWSSINSEFQDIDWPTEMMDCSVVEMYNKFEQHIINVCTRHAPARAKYNQRNTIPNERLALLRRKKRLNSKINFRKYVSANKSPTLIQKLELKKEKVEEQIKSSIKAQNEKKEIEAIEKIKKNPKMFFTYVKKFKKTESRIGPLTDEDGQTHSDARTKANLLQQQYTKVFSDPEKAPAEHLNQNNEREYPPFLDIDFTIEDVKKAIDAIPNAAAPGPDKLPAAILKQCKEQLSLPIYLIWRKSLDTSEIPETLKRQGIVPIFKKGNKACPANYRPVSLTSHLIKLFERILRIKLVKYIEDNNLLSDDQHGFRERRNCLTQLLKHIDNILRISESDDNADVIYLDFAKAFDKVDHKILLSKLRNMGIQGKIYQWIESFLCNRQQHIIVDGEISESAEVKSGVPQGTVLGPVLFLLFINDITEAIQYADIQIFADDCKLTLKIENQSDHQKLQRDIEAAIMWSLMNNMELNKEKFQLIHHGKNEELKLDYTLDRENTLKPSSEIKDLGVTVSDDLSWLKHIVKISNEGKKFASWILRCFKTRSPVVLQLFKTFVISKLEYASPLWMPYQKKDIEKIEALQRTFTSRLHGLDNLNYHERLKALNLYSLQRRRERFCIITVWKILNGLHPNQINLNFYTTPRFGVKCRRQISKAKRLHIRTLHYNSFASIGPALFNTIPKATKEKESLSSFKSSLDKYLQSIPDKPPTPGYPFLNGNSLLEWSGSRHYSPLDLMTTVRCDTEVTAGAEEIVCHGDASIHGDASCI